MPTIVRTRSRKNVSHTRTHSSREAASPQRPALAMAPPSSQLRCRLRGSGERVGAELSVCRPTPWCCNSGASHACAKGQAQTVSLFIMARLTKLAEYKAVCVPRARHA